MIDCRWQERFEGGLKEGKMHGTGVYQYANGDQHIGEWKNGLRYVMLCVHGMGEHHCQCFCIILSNFLPRFTGMGGVP